MVSLQDAAEPSMAGDISERNVGPWDFVVAARAYLTLMMTLPFARPFST
jgi:hypothetical protein